MIFKFLEVLVVLWELNDRILKTPTMHRHDSEVWEYTSETSVVWHAFSYSANSDFLIIVIYHLFVSQETNLRESCRVEFKATWKAGCMSGPH